MLNKLVDTIKNSKDSPLYLVSHVLYDVYKNALYSFYYFVMRSHKLEKRVIATAFNGTKYADNTKYILEEIHNLDPSIELVWLIDKKLDYDVPEYVKKSNCIGNDYSFAKLHFSSAVWLNTHLYDKYLTKRKGQLVLNTWHGGLGIKKIEADVPKFRENKFQIQKLKKNAKLIDIFVSNSDFLSDIYRRAFLYQGEILKVGFPKSDILFKNGTEIINRIKSRYNLDLNVKIILYAPTYRASSEDSGVFDFTPYNIDFKSLKDSFERKYNEKYVVMLKWHPSMVSIVEKVVPKIEGVIDVTKYPDIQELVLACDILITDYSSCIFDAALIEKPGFIFATDYDDYKKDRGTYFELDDLPFPYATNMEELISCIESFDYEHYCEKIAIFSNEMGLLETGHAAKDVAEYIVNQLNTKK